MLRTLRDSQFDAKAAKGRNRARRAYDAWTLQAFRRTSSTRHSRRSGAFGRTQRAYRSTRRHVHLEIACCFRPPSANSSQVKRTVKTSRITSGSAMRLVEHLLCCMPSCTIFRRSVTVNLDPLAPPFGCSHAVDQTKDPKIQQGFHTTIRLLLEAGRSRFLPLFFPFFVSRVTIFISSPESLIKYPVHAYRVVTAVPSRWTATIQHVADKEHSGYMQFISCTRGCQLHTV